MKYLIPLLILMGCAGVQADEKKPTAPVKPPEPISINGTPAKLAEIDPVTLKVTYSKGADPKAVVAEMVKAWAQAQGQLQQCVQQLQAKEKK